MRLGLRLWRLSLLLMLMMMMMMLLGFWFWFWFWFRFWFWLCLTLRLPLTSLPFLPHRRVWRKFIAAERRRKRRVRLLLHPRCSELFSGLHGLVVRG